MTHPIPQALRDRFDQIERDIMGNAMGPSSVFTQMRTAVQAYFSAHADPFTGGAAPDPVFAHLAHCNGCFVCGGWREAMAPHVEPVEVVDVETADQACTMLDFALSFALCNMDHGGTRRDVKKAQKHLERLRELMASERPQGLTWEAQGEANQYMLFKDGNWFAAVQMNGAYWREHQEEFFSSIATPHVCLLPPEGWQCSRRAGHSGPCAATPVTPEQHQQ